MLIEEIRLHNKRWSRLAVRTCKCHGNNITAFHFHSSVGANFSSHLKMRFSFGSFKSLRD
jgi:hypothetical protein